MNQGLPFINLGAIGAARPGSDALQSAPTPPEPDRSGEGLLVSYFELARVMERASRRFYGVLRAELTMLGVDDIGPAQAMVLLAIGGAELSVGELLDRGHYMGSNVSYHLKQLAEGDYIDRVASQRDKRSARIRLSEKGKKLCAGLREAGKSYDRGLSHAEAERRDLETAFQTLLQLELVWSNAVRYGI
ncbi:MarR family transcriptional regulator (plasmid) [Ensifer sp. D2-11]